MPDKANGKPSIGDIVELVEQDHFEAALALADNLGARPMSSLFDSGRLAGLGWYCRYMLDDALDADSLSRHVAEETRADFLTGLGVQLSELGVLNLAEPVLRRLTLVAPDDPRAWYNYGYVLSKQEGWQPAIEAFQRAQELDATLATAYYEMGRCYLESGAPQHAAAAFKRFLSLEPDDINGLVLGGIAHSDAGQYHEAVALFERAILVNPKDPSAYFSLAVVAHRNEDLARLENLQRSISRIAPDDWRALLIAAKVYELHGKLQNAWDTMEDAFLRAVGAEDRDNLDVIAESALGFAFRHGFGDRIDPWIESIFHHDCLDPGTLHFLRALTEPVLDRACSFGVLVEGREQAEDELPPDKEPPGREVLGYYRMLWVFAETEEDAEAIAMAFDRRLGGQPVSAETLDAEAGVTNVHRGVHRRAKDAAFFSLDTAPG